MKISDILTEAEMKELASPFAPPKPDMKMEEGETDPYKKYPRSHFPKTKAENMRMLAAKRLAAYKLKKRMGSSTGGGETNIGSPVGSSSGNDY